VASVCAARARLGAPLRCIQCRKYKATYVVVTAFASINLVVSFVFRIRNALHIHRQMSQLAVEEEEVKLVTQSPHRECSKSRLVQSAPRRQVQKYEWEFKQSSRALVIHALNVMTMVSEG